MKKNNQEGNDTEEMLSWVNDRFVKSLAKIHCLALIAKGHTHGYDMIKYVREQYGLKVSAGSYYPILQWLEEKGYIKGILEHMVGRPDKKTYKVTPQGMSVLRAVQKHLIVLVQGLSAQE